MTESILSSASYVWRRGKPSTWLPRQKLAEERIPAPERHSLATSELPRRSWHDSRIFHFFKIFKNFQVSGRFIWTWNNSAHSLCMKLRFCMPSAKAYFSNAIFLYRNVESHRLTAQSVVGNEALFQIYFEPEWGNLEFRQSSNSSKQIQNK